MASEHYINSYRDLALNAIEDLKNYANDERPERRIVSSREYTKDLERLDSTRPAPAATDTGLETLSVELTPSGHPYMKSDPEGDYVTRSQAEELLAGRDTVIEMQADSIDNLERKVRHWQDRAEKADELLAEKDAIIERHREAQVILGKQLDEVIADNAAQAARIEELEEDVEWAQNAVLARQRHAEARCEALEAKLAAAQKALEPFAKIPVSTVPEGRLGHVPDKHPYMVDLDGNVLFTASDIREARAVLGGKPS
ncbi:hypothetical protein [Brucella pseudintermedia]|uniref:hypothetical protein n=1 Tax=Brucella pseudintermedia TaxID=370111 RepID=UPI00124E1166|nr:hypothetical protein [Brucella pseudintermedia]KAB2679775.1 hypothetical protein F9K78_19310 [Brucella pseudintermedia]